MVTVGMTSAQVIVAVTPNPADLLGLADADTFGAGRRVGFLALKANPLYDITNTRQLVSVALNGEKVVRSVTE